MLPTLLIVEDERATREGLRSALEEEFDVYTASSASEALAILKSEPIKILLTDLRLGGDSGMDLLDAALALPEPPVAIMMTAYGSVDTAVEAMRRGAWHFVTKPLNLDEVEMLLKRALRNRTLETENQQLVQQVKKSHKLDRLIGKSTAIGRVSELVQQVAPTRATVLIEGESGTGKEVVAHTLHHLSGRPAAKMVIVHCAALSPQLLESELFGHEKGAFTGASQRRIGRFEQADGGTLFLDEIGDMPLSIQVKLLRVLQDGSFSRVGANETLTTDVRIVAATHKNLSDEVAAGRFREDLYYRLNVVEIKIPALRERLEDIPLLAEYFLQRITRKNGMARIRISAEAIATLQTHNWPGNVRELENTIARACALASSQILLPADIPLASAPRKSPAGFAAAMDQLINAAPTGEALLEWLNAEIATRVLERSDGDLKEASNMLNLPLAELRKLLALKK